MKTRPTISPDSELGYPSRLRAWLNNAPIQDPVNRRMAALLQVILIGFIVIIAIAAGINLVIAQEISWQVNLIRSSIAILIIGIPLGLLRRGYFRSPVLIILAIFLTLETYAMTVSNLREIVETLSLFTLAIVLAGLLVGRRALVLTFVWSAGAVGLSAFREQSAGLGNDGIVIASNFILLNGLMSLFLDRFGVTLRAALTSALERESQLQSEINERKMAEKALRESEERYRKLIGTARDVIFTLAADGTFTSLNPSFETFTGWSRAEWLGRSFEGLIAETDRPRALDVFNRILRGETLGAIRLRVHTRAGETLVIELNMSPQTKDGRAVGLLGIARDMTEEQRAEDALKASEERFRALTAATTDGLVFHDKGQIVDVNPALVLMFGYEDASEMVGRGLLEFVAPVSRELVLKQVQSGSTQPYEAFGLRKDGSVFPVEASARLYEYRGRTVRVASIHDATERKQADENLRQMHNQLEAMLNALPDLLFEVDRQGRIYDYRPSAGNQLYVAPEAFIGKTVREVLPREAAETCVHAIEEAAEFGKHRGAAYSLNMPSGPGWYELSIAAKGDFRAPDARFIVLARDITERKQAEDNLQRRAEELTVLYHTTYDLTVQTDVNVLLQTIARRASDLLGVPESGIFLFDPIKKDLEIVASTNDIAPTGFRLKLGEGMAGRVAESRQPMIVEDYSRWEGRSERLKDAPFASDLEVPMLYQGELIGVLDVYDIHREGEPPDAPKRKFTEADANLLSLFASAAAGAVYGARLHQQVQRHAEDLEQRVIERTRELAQANARLTELDALKTKFVSDVSHELRTPVTNLRLYLNLLERGRPEKRAQYMTVLQEQTTRLAQLIEDILDLSRLERDRERLVFEPVNLNALADRVMTAQLPRTEADGLRLTFDPDLDLPPVRGEANRLTQVITNLVVNAIDYTPSGSVQVSTRCAGDRVCVEVQDTGLGIDVEDLPHIFERFYRGRRVTASNIPGTGLGLSIVKEIVELHGGAVEVESRVGEGSTFRIWLPLGSAD